MNRRSFFNMLGSAVIGTVIALKIPDSIAPFNAFVEDLKKSVIVTLSHRELKHPLAILLRNHAHQMYCENGHSAIFIDGEDNV